MILSQWLVSEALGLFIWHTNNVSIQSKNSLQSSLLLMRCLLKQRNKYKHLSSQRIWFLKKSEVTQICDLWFEECPNKLLQHVWIQTWPMAICTFCFKCGSRKDSYDSVSCLGLQKSASSPVLQVLCLRTAWREFAKARHPPLPNSLVPDFGSGECIGYTASKNAQPFPYAVWKQKVY